MNPRHPFAIRLEPGSDDEPPRVVVRAPARAWPFGSAREHTLSLAEAHQLSDDLLRTVADGLRCLGA